MKYVDGQSLADIIEKEGRLRPRRALQIVKQITQGLAHLHKFSLVHRDVKPGNILVTPENKAVLVDMGLTKSTKTQADLTTEGIILGTPYYLSPEQALGELLDIRSDIYSLGATFYHALTGSVPFRGATTIAIINARFISEVESLRDYVPLLSEQINTVVFKMMERNPGERYQTPEELLQALEEAEKSI